ncbi:MULTISPECIES: hypothetical protein [Rhodanobacter]|uniref:Uncharacterized protein n=2 Tax=Rhodanobacter TaxID=75309 RepID=I4W175_9GAMM|nr:hypothetical protein [Rhodanobacter spathiphylli]EIL93216.1 hypothetical protein UU7_09520 [Rhodanobacter spathiphylli B39]
MGNTNLPQAGAADTDNSRDTRSGNAQLTDRQRKEGDTGQELTPPDRPKDPPVKAGRDADMSAYTGHANTGHSPSDAT